MLQPVAMFSFFKSRCKSWKIRCKTTWGEVLTAGKQEHHSVNQPPQLCTSHLPYLCFRRCWSWHWHWLLIEELIWNYIILNFTVTHFKYSTSTSYKLEQSSYSHCSFLANIILSTVQAWSWPVLPLGLLLPNKHPRGWKVHCYCLAADYLDHLDSQL